MRGRGSERGKYYGSRDGQYPSSKLPTCDSCGHTGYNHDLRECHMKLKEKIANMNAQTEKKRKRERTIKEASSEYPRFKFLKNSKRT